MIQTPDINKQNYDFEQKKLIMMGATVNQKQISGDEIKKMRENYIKMCFAFTLINWGSGKTLGVSWQKALEQMDAYVATKSKNPTHPFYNELVKYHKNFRHDWAKSIMTNPYVDDKLSPHAAESFYKYGNETLVPAKDILDKMYKQYTPQIVQNVKSDKLSQQTSTLLQQIVMQRIARIRT